MAHVPYTLKQIMHINKMALNKLIQFYLLLLQLLFEASCMRVEKIKVAGWTYMAACGLDPGRRDSINSINRDSHPEHVVLVLTRFAAKMMGVLQKINRETFQTFKLRVGQLQCMHFNYKLSRKSPKEAIFSFTVM
jgi:hypothetical protein